MNTLGDLAIEARGGPRAAHAVQEPISVNSPQEGRG